MKNQTPPGTLLKTDEPSGPDPGFWLGAITIFVLVAMFGFTVYFDSLFVETTLESVAVSACEFLAETYVGVAFLTIMIALAARFDFRIADKIYLSDTAKIFVRRPHPASSWIDGFIHALVLSALVANGHTNTAGFLFFASIALMGCVWLMTSETRKYVSSIPERG